MPYTLLKFLVWAIAFVAIGVLIGWLLRALKCRAEVAAARRSTVDQDEVDRMRHRLANLETVVAERDELRIRLARREALAQASGSEPALEPQPDPEPATEPEPAAEPIDEPAVERAAVEPAATGDAPVAGFAALPDEPADADSAVTSEDAAGAEDAAGVDDAAAGGESTAAALDLDAAAATIGTKTRLDDLTVVEGIGPKIAELCSGIGIDTWRALAGTDVATLRSMLDDAGSRYRMHDPGTWPTQAGLLADGRWDEFVQLTDELDGGR